MIFLSVFLCFAIFGRIQAADNRRQFYDLAELIKIIETAREAGMSDEDLKKLEIRDGDKVINVLEHIANIERLKKLKDERLKAFLAKKFLTVNDVFKELVRSEPAEIKKLREELVSER